MESTHEQVRLRTLLVLLHKPPTANTAATKSKGKEAIKSPQQEGRDGERRVI